MRLPPGYELENVWAHKDSALRSEIVDFWIASGALRSRERAGARVDQVIFVVRRAGSIAGVSTVFRKRDERIGQEFYNFRCFVAEEDRRYNLGAVLLVTVRDYLNERFVSGEDTSAVGMLVEIENERLKRKRNQAVWPISGMVYVGNNRRGDHVRVWYFTGARIR